ncbi:S-adenosyl-L-methionine-dependent methyltransferase [Lophiostoma macrostomum CBS 122681]|uniref:S-adenosyl-L-methionine-dependent methyltransferase n=1 Tax=Lophiostoma macrostomum CBS 122681 TaxID=1314788 RepID=A0A6A6TI58_9PLEO|nr:S-adenosyl-L-methionine-dependent methyltransferase [Lophiostoma macrostomum CBS 122681]
MNVNDAERIMRHAVSQGIFLEPEPGVIAHSAISQAIVNVPNTDAMMSNILDNMWTSAPRIVDAMAKWPGSEEPNETAFNIAHHTSATFFEELAKNEERARIFAGSMTWLQSAPPMRPSFAVEGYDWSVHKKMVDVGGSHGVIAREIVEKNPSMKIVVQDRPEVVECAPKDVVENVEWAAHDFFTEQPIKDADVYFLRWILHDFSDKYCIKILRALVPALKKGARIVLMEHILPEPGTISAYQQRLVLGFDMCMKELFNAKERTEKEWRALIRDTHDHLKVVDVYTPEGSQLGFIVTEWEG